MKPLVQGFSSVRIFFLLLDFSVSVHGTEFIEIYSVIQAEKVGIILNSLSHTLHLVY